MKKRTFAFSRTVGTCLLAAVGAVSCAEAGDADRAEPIDLKFDPSVGLSITYVANYNQAIALHMGGQEMSATREFAAKYTITGTDPAEGSARGTVRVDSLNVALVSAQGRQRFDTRNLIGSEFVIGVAPTGGSPTYEGEIPAPDFGAMAGGEVPVSSLLEYAFLHLPDHPVSPGDTWSGMAVRKQIEGSLRVTANLTTAYTLIGWSEVDGTDCARIDGQVSADITGTEEQMGSTWDYSGGLEGTASWCVDPATGSLVEMTGEEKSAGSITSGENDIPIEQTTTIQIRKIEGQLY